MRITHKGTEPGASLNTPEGDFVADDDGYFDVPAHLGTAQVKFPGWKEAGAAHFTGDPKPKPGADSSEDYAALSRRLDTLEGRVEELSKASPAKPRASTSK